MTVIPFPAKPNVAEMEQAYYRAKAVADRDLTVASMRAAVTAYDRWLRAFSGGRDG